MTEYICVYCDDLQKFDYISEYVQHNKKFHAKEEKEEKNAKPNVDKLIKYNLSEQKNQQLVNQMLYQNNPMGNIQFDEIIEELDNLAKTCKGIRKINTKIKRNIPEPNTVNNDIVIDIDIDEAYDKETINKVVSKMYEKINNQTVNNLPGNTVVNNNTGASSQDIQKIIENLFGSANNNYIGKINNNGNIIRYSDKPINDDDDEKVGDKNKDKNKNEYADKNKENYNNDNDDDEEDDEDENEYYGTFLYENTESDDDNDHKNVILIQDLYKRFTIWFGKKFQNKSVPSKEEFTNGIGEFYTIYDDIVIKGKKKHQGIRGYKFKN